MPEAAPILRIGRTDFYIFAGLPEGDITQSGAEVLVSSAGTDATMSSGVSKAILQKGGEEILSGLRAHAPLTPGDVVITSAGKIKAKNIYHAVVVGWGDKKRVLQASVWRAVSRCMELAQLTGMTSIAFPSLGTGKGGAERYETHSTMAAACLDTLRADSSLRRILFCFDYADTGQTFRTAFLQQRLIRQARGLAVADDTEQAQLTDNLAKLWPALLGLHVNVEKLAVLVEQLERNPSAAVINYHIGDIIGSTGVAIGERARAVVRKNG